ncbi:hypothetical protein PG988_007383 [Apiospora saccharicola]
MDNELSGMKEHSWLALVFEDIGAFESAGGLHEGMGIVVRRYGDFYERVGNIKLDKDFIYRVSRSTGEQVIKDESPFLSGSKRQLRAPLKGSTQQGLIGAASSFLGDVANMTYSVTSAGFNGGTHNTPYNQQMGRSTRWIQYSHSPDDPAAGLYGMKEMPSGLFFAADTADLSHVGHGALNPGYTSTIFLQIPTLDNKIPEHTVLHAGVCTAKDTIGLNTL